MARARRYSQGWALRLARAGHCGQPGLGAAARLGATARARHYGES